MTSARGRHAARDALVRVAVWWLWMPLLAVLTRVVKHVLFGGFGQQDQSYLLLVERLFFPHGGPMDAAPLFWFWLAIGLGGTGVALRYAAGESGAGLRDRWVRLATAAVVLAVLGSLVRAGTGLWDDDKDAGRFYARSTVLDVPAGGAATPRSVLPVTEHSRPGDGARCDLVGTSDVPACVKTAPMPDFDFEARTASYAAATKALTDSAGLTSGVHLLNHSLHYLPGAATGGADGARAGGAGVWTAVLDGSGEQPMEGVAVWDGGSNSVTSCAFGGDHAFDRAFGGTGAVSLRNLLAERFPDLVYSDQDVWGYCDGPDVRTARPVIVISVARQTGWKRRTVLAPAGVLVLRGSADGRPDLAHRPTAAPGDLPGAVYPASVVRSQIHEVQWLGGRGAKDDRGFGYDHTAAAANATNPGEFLLRSKADGHLYYVTPLVPRDSSSQLVVAFAVLQADRVGDGLNDLHVYVRADDAPSVNLDVLASRMVSYMAQRTSVTISAGEGGALQEIIPFGRDMWRGFVDFNGQTQDYIDLSGDATVTPNLVSLKGAVTPPGAQPQPQPDPAATPTAPAPAPATPAPQPSTAPVGCGGDPARLSDRQLADCIAELSRTLQGRLPAGG
ncbi:hypothetical protein K353_05001 [Kitasatospora sp. SolWspMP-SS2h]|uniref:hypothetical protein n=1 Tax=Kitasatospora sp. SolWspMP-SS2h TaxID=1305729 RepID=UPI000DBA5F72|nr:hypothetical protein [Kitasatospora sp. SolWspMP-SS2h]RAJ35798.1 hypothetical protein K353_05001 [Kitasatospora sp. SolWspMP-SS2h]